MSTMRKFTAVALNLGLGFGLCLGIASFGIGAVMVPAAAPAQTRGPVQRTIHGKVVEKGGAGIKGAVVYLKDGRTSAVKSAIADDDGSYRFVQLSQSTDYELWAQSDAKKSKTKSISSFDSKNDFDITLTID